MTHSILSYQKDGYAVVRNCLPQSIIKKLIDLTEQLERDSDLQKNFHDHYRYEAMHPKVIRRISSPEKIIPCFLSLIKQSGVIDVVCGLLGSDVRLERVKIHSKAAYYGSAIRLHQDWAYQMYTNDDVLMLSIFLDPNSEDNGPIRVLPGSHRGPIYPHTDQNDVFSGFIENDKAKLPLSDFISMTGNPGDVALHHYRTVHYSEANFSQQSRRMLLLRFAAADAWPIMGSLDFFHGFDYNELKSRIVVGKQTLEPRMTAVPLRIPGLSPSGVQE